MNDFFCEFQLYNCLIKICFCIGIAGIVSLGMSFMNISDIIHNTDSNLEQRPEKTVINDKPAKERTNHVVNINYTTKLINGRSYRILYDKNQAGGSRLRAVYVRRRFSNETVNIDGQEYVGIKFVASDLTGHYALRYESSNPSFYFTQHQMRDGIWVPKPIGAVRRNTGLTSLITGDTISANGQVPRLSPSSLQMFIPGGSENS
jgi:hypothetical protein